MMYLQFLWQARVNEHFKNFLKGMGACIGILAVLTAAFIFCLWTMTPEWAVVAMVFFILSLIGGFLFMVTSR